MIEYQNEIEIGDTTNQMDVKMMGEPVHLELVLEQHPQDVPLTQPTTVTDQVRIVRSSTRKKVKKEVVVGHVKKSLGRRLEDVWNEFEVTILGPNKKMTVCRHCATKTSDGARAYRLREHLAKCQKFQDVYGKNAMPSWFTSSIKDEVDASNTSRRGRPRNSKATATANEYQTLVRKGDKGKTGKSAIFLVNEKEKINKQLTRFFVSTRTPFNLVNNEEFVTLVKMLRPDYVLPTLEQLSGVHFETICKDLRTEAEESIAGEKVVLLQSGWSKATVSTHRLIHHTLKHGNKTFFLNTVEMLSETSGHDCSSVLIEAISFAETQYNCLVMGVITDYISRFEEIRSIFQEGNPSLHVLASQMHLVLFVGQIFVDDEVMDKILKIYKYFRSYDFECNKMKEDIMNCPETRWNNDHDALLAFVRDREKYMEILTDPQYHGSKVHLIEPVIQVSSRWNSEQEAELLEILNDTELCKKAEEMVSAISPIQISLENVLKDGCSLADGVSSWLSWTTNSTFSGDQFQRIMEYKNIAVTPCSLAAYMLHPKYKGMLLSEDEMETGRSYIISVNFQYLDPTVAFIQSDCSIYPKSLMTDVICKTMDPIRWWKEQLRNTRLPTGFAQFTLSLLALPANVYSWERSFSS